MRAAAGDAETRRCAACAQSNLTPLRMRSRRLWKVRARTAASTASAAFCPVAIPLRLCFRRSPTFGSRLCVAECMPRVLSCAGGGGDIFTQHMLASKNAQARAALEDVQEKHKDIQKLEKSIEELHQVRCCVAAHMLCCAWPPLVVPAAGAGGPAAAAAARGAAVTASGAVHASAGIAGRAGVRGEARDGWQSTGGGGRYSAVARCCRRYLVSTAQLFSCCPPPPPTPPRNVEFAWRMPAAAA